MRNTTAEHDQDMTNACNQAFAQAQLQTPSLDTDFIQGCLDGVHDHP
jgi:hypothetical protein